MIRSLVLVLVVACGSSQPAPQPPPPPAPAPEPAPAAHAHGHGDHVHHGHGGHRFEKAEDWVPMFDGPARDAWQKPDLVVGAMAIQPGMAVADVGAGTGYFESRLAAAVGATGKVIAVDVEADMVRYIGERAKREATPNVEARLGAADDPNLAPGSVDRILIVDVWHHLANRSDYARKLSAALKPRGALYVVDFTLETERGPPKAMRLEQSVIGRELEAAGLAVTAVKIDLPDQYMLRAERR